MTWTKGGAVACSHDGSQCSSPAEIAILPSIIDIDMETKIAPVIGTWRHVKPCTITVLLPLVLQVYTVSRVAGSVPGWAELSHCCHRWHGSSPGDLHLHLLVQGWLLATSSDPWLLLVLAWLLHQSEYWLCTAPAQTWVENLEVLTGLREFSLSQCPEMCLLDRFWIVKALVGTFNKEMAVVRALFKHCQISRRPIDSSKEPANTDQE